VNWTRRRRSWGASSFGPPHLRLIFWGGWWLAPERRAPRRPKGTRSVPVCFLAPARRLWSQARAYAVASEDRNGQADAARFVRDSDQRRDASAARTARETWTAGAAEDDRFAAYAGDRGL
jgi:hypothetical protein